MAKEFCAVKKIIFILLLIVPSSVLADAIHFPEIPGTVVYS